MADEPTTDQPLADLAAAEDRIAAPEAEPMTGEQRLRAFEDLHFGEKAVRINGRIERGSGSPYQMAHPAVREQHARLEKLIESEQKLAEAHAALMAADEAHEAAQKAVTDAEKQVDGASDE